MKIRILPEPATDWLKSRFPFLRNERFQKLSAKWGFTLLAIILIEGVYLQYLVAFLAALVVIGALCWDLAKRSLPGADLCRRDEGGCGRLKHEGEMSEIPHVCKKCAPPIVRMRAGFARLNRGLEEVRIAAKVVGEHRPQDREHVPPIDTPAFDSEGKSTDGSVQPLPTEPNTRS